MIYIYIYIYIYIREMLYVFEINFEHKLHHTDFTQNARDTNRMNLFFISVLLKKSITYNLEDTISDIYQFPDEIKNNRILCWHSPMARETWVQSQVESYRRLKKWYLMLLCLTPSIIR